jgi:hypothetical protein
VVRRVSDISVRDHRQTAELKDDQIIVTSYVGRERAGAYSIPLSVWLATLKDLIRVDVRSSYSGPLRALMRKEER